MLDGVQLEAHAEVAHTLLRLDEGAPDVVVANQPELDGNAALVRVAHGCSDTGIRDRDHDVRTDRRLQRKLSSHGVT